MIAVQKRGVIVLNYGNVFLKEGDVLSVFDVGEQFIDPDTKEVLGSEETLRGSITVTAASPKFSKAKFADQGFPVARGDIVRRPSGTETAKRAAKRTRSGATWENESTAEEHQGD